MAGWDINARLENWGAVQRTKLRYGQCGSAEGNHRSDPNAAWAEPPPPSRKYPLNVPDAELIEHSVCAISMFFHAVLRYSFVDKLPDVGICRLTERVTGKRIHPHRDLPTVMDAAIKSLVEQLGQPATTRKERARQRIIRIRSELGLDIQDDAA